MTIKPFPEQMMSDWSLKNRKFVDIGAHSHVSDAKSFSGCNSQAFFRPESLQFALSVVYCLRSCQIAFIWSLSGRNFCLLVQKMKRFTTEFVDEIGNIIKRRLSLNSGQIKRLRFILMLSILSQALPLCNNRGKEFGEIRNQHWPPKYSSFILIKRVTVEEIEGRCAEKRN
ncbi:MAG: hypothetical protein MHMPM18_000761 [Marteilia pararefringens]